MVLTDTVTPSFPRSIGEFSAGRAPLRVLIIASERPPVRSGIARAVQVLSEELVRRGHSVDVLAYPDFGRLVISEVRISTLALKSWTILNAVEKYDIVHIHGVAPTVSELALLLLCSKRRPAMSLVYTHHFGLALKSLYWINSVYNSIHRRLSSFSDEVVTTSEGYARSASARANTSVIPLGVHSESFAYAGEKDAKFTVLCVGQFRPYKGIRIVMEAVARVGGVKLIIAGSGPEERIYRALAKNLGLDVEFHVDAGDTELRSAYARSHVIALPSTTNMEAFGLVLLEGMSAGCIPVASDLQGVREVVGRLGFTFPSGNIEALSRILRRLRDDSLLVSLIAPRVRLRAQEFSWRRTVDGYERLYLDLYSVKRLSAAVNTSKRYNSRSAWEEFIQSVRKTYAADYAHVWMKGGTGRLESIASASDGEPSAIHGVDPTCYNLAKYVCETGESLSVGPHHHPVHVKQFANISRDTLAVRFCGPKLATGVLLLSRSSGFEHHDMDSLIRLGHHLSRILP